MRFLLVLAMLGFLSSLANAQVAQLTCPKQKITRVFGVNGTDENIVEKMKEKISNALNEFSGVSREIIIKQFDNYLTANGMKYTKIDKHEFKTEVTGKYKDDILGDYKGTAEYTATLVETSDPTIYSVKFVVYGVMTTEKDGNYDSKLEIYLINCFTGTMV